jgi:lysophospholipase L1-like esterase
VSKSEKKIITILGDSLSMVRSEENITLWLTYPYLLIHLLGDSYHIVNRSKRGNTSLIQTNPQYLYDDVQTSESSYVIIQIGICDCSPRIISKYERFILKYFFHKTLSSYYIRFKSRFRKFFTKNFPKTYVSKSDFELMYKKLLESILQLRTIKKVILVNIASTNNINMERSYGFENNINHYNDIIKRLISTNSKCYLIDLFSYTVNDSSLLVDDGIHITKEAHCILANDIVRIINDN